MGAAIGNSFWGSFLGGAAGAVLGTAIIAVATALWKWVLVPRWGFWVKELEPSESTRRFRVRSLWFGEMEKIHYYLSPTYSGTHKGERAAEEVARLGRTTVSGDWSGGNFPGSGGASDGRGGRKHKTVTDPVKLTPFETFIVGCDVRADEEFSGYFVVEGEFVNGWNRRGRAGVVEVPETEEPVY